AAGAQGRIRFHDIGDYLDRERKLHLVREYFNVSGIKVAGKWKKIVPDAHGDWLSQRASGFEKFIAMGAKRGGGVAIFENYSNGVQTNRDAWAFNASRVTLAASMRRTIEAYTGEVTRFATARSGKAVSTA